MWFIVLLPLFVSVGLLEPWLFIPITGIAFVVGITGNKENEKGKEKIKMLKFERTTYSDGYKDYPAIYVRWVDVEEFLGEKHSGDYEQDEKIVKGLLAAGAPAWVKDVSGWVDEYGWGLYLVE